MRGLILLVCFLMLLSRSMGQDSLITSYPLRYNTSSLRNVALTTLQNKKTSLPVHAAGLTVMVFLSPECPLCKNYSRTLNELHREFSSDVNLVGIIPGKAYTAKEIRAYVNDYALRFPVLIDQQKDLSRAVGATVTPEVILMDKAGTVHYRGAIDDWVVSLGKKKLKPGVAYLKNAIVQIRSGGEVAQKTTRPVGCLINDY